MPFFTNDGRSQPRRAGKHLMGVLTTRSVPTGRTFPWGPGTLYISEGFDHTDPPTMYWQLSEGFES